MADPTIDSLQLEKPLIIATAPYYEDMLWFEQLLDILGGIPRLELYVPKVMQGTNEIEMNITNQLILDYFSALPYEIFLLEDNRLFASQYLQQHQQVNDKLNGYMKSEEPHVTIKLMNSELTSILAMQYQSLLPEILQNSFKAFENQLVAAISTIPIKNTVNQVILAPNFVYRELFKTSQFSSLQSYQETLSKL